MNEPLLVVYGVVVGAIIMLAVGLAVFDGEREVEVPIIICPPMIDAADAVILHYPPDGGPEPTKLDWEFAEACGFKTIKGPAPVVPPPPEEGGA